MLKNRHFMLLKKIESVNNLAQLSEDLDITERNIRYQIREINDFLGDKKIKIKKRIIQNTLSNEDLSELLSSMEIKTYNYSQFERIELMILRYLFKDGVFVLKEVSEELNVSISTLRLDIKEMEDCLKAHNIELIQNKNMVFTFNYDEMNLRYFASNFLYKYIEFDREDDTLYIEQNTFFKKIIYNEIKKDYLDDLNYIYKKIKELDLNYLDETLNMLVILMAFSKKRNKHLDKIEICYEDVLKNKSEYEELKNNFKDYTEKEILIFIKYLFEVSRDEDNILLRYPNWYQIEFALSKLANDFENRNGLEKEISYDLYTDLLDNIKPLLFRSKNKIQWKNSILNDVKNIYPKTFEMMQDLFEDFEESLKMKIPDEEKAFLLPLFRKAVERKTSKKEKLLLVSSYKFNIASFLKDNIEEEFQIKIDKIYGIKKFMTEYEKYKNTYRELVVVTTDDLNIKDKNITIIKVNPILNDADIKKLEDMGLARNYKIKISQILQTIKKHCRDVSLDTLIAELKEKFSDRIEDDTVHKKSSLTGYINKNNIYKLNMTGLEEIIKHISNNFIEEGKIKNFEIESFLNPVENGEDSYYLNNNTLVLLPKVYVSADEMGVSIAILEEELRLKFKAIKNIILFFSSEKQNHAELINSLVRIFNKDDINKHFLGKNSEEICELIIKNL